MSTHPISATVATVMMVFSFLCAASDMPACCSRIEKSNNRESTWKNKIQMCWCCRVVYLHANTSETLVRIRGVLIKKCAHLSVLFAVWVCEFSPSHSNWTRASVKGMCSGPLEALECASIPVKSRSITNSENRVESARQHGQYFRFTGRVRQMHQICEMGRSLPPGPRIPAAGASSCPRPPS